MKHARIAEHYSRIITMLINAGCIHDVDLPAPKLRTSYSKRMSSEGRAWSLKVMHPRLSLLMDHNKNMSILKTVRGKATPVQVDINDFLYDFDILGNRKVMKKVLIELTYIRTLMHSMCSSHIPVKVRFQNPTEEG